MSQTYARIKMTGAEHFWYILGCIALGAMYFAKVPAKKALAQCGHGTMTEAEHFWYVVMCIAFGAGYFAKLPMVKALTEVAAADQASANRTPPPDYSVSE